MTRDREVKLEVKSRKGGYTNRAVETTRMESPTESPCCTLTLGVTRDSGSTVKPEVKSRQEREVSEIP